MTVRIFDEFHLMSVDTRAAGIATEPEPKRILTFDENTVKIEQWKSRSLS